MTRRPGRHPLRHEAALLGAAFLFGTTFVVVQDAVEAVEPLPFLAARFAFGAAALLPFAARRRPRAPATALGGIGVVAGLALAGGYVLQTVGLQYTTTQVSAFLTYLLVVFVPVLGALVHRRLPSGPAGVAVVMAVAGVALLTGGHVGFGYGEALTIGSALSYAVHILVVDHWAGRVDLLRLNAVQLGVVAVVCFVPGLLLGGHASPLGVWAAFPATVWWAALYTGLFASALSFGLQLYGQRGIEHTRSALLLLTEPVFAAILGYLVGERLGAAGVAGAVLVLSAIVVAEARGPLTGRSRVGEPDGDGRSDRAPSRVRALGPP